MLREQRLAIFYEMPHIDINLPKNGKCMMEVRTREGRNIPHLHIIGISKKTILCNMFGCAKIF